MVLRLSAILFVLSRIFCHLTDDTALNAKIYYGAEATWQVLLIVGVYVGGLSKKSRLVLLYLIPFFAIEFAYTMLHTFGIIVLDSHIEAETVVMVECYLTTFIIIRRHVKETYGTT